MTTPTEQILPKDTVQSEGAASPRVRAFFGLKWKVMLLSSLILFAIVISFCVISYLSLVDNFESQMDRRYRRYTKEVEGLIGQTSQNLRQLAEMIPFLRGMDSGLLTGSAEDIIGAFDHHWATLQLHNGIEAVRFYNQAGQLLAGWGMPESDKEHAAMQNWVHEVNLREQPITPLSCAENCTQYVVEPLLVEGSKVGAIVMGVSLADAILGFESISGADIGLLIREEAGSPASGGMRIANWARRVTALTNSSRSLAILDQAAQEYPDFSSLENGVQIFTNNRYLRVKLLPPTGGNPSGESRLLVITDITPTVNAIHGSIQQNVAIGLLGLLLSETLLFIILSRPLSRLKHIVFALPLLAGSTFKEFRSALRPPGQMRWSKDEIDMLDETVVSLSYQLEKLEAQVADRTRVLASQMDELSKERDFVANLLDTAQVIVLTQTADGQITTLNAHGETLIYYAEKELQGRPFIGLLAPQGGLSDLPANLEELRAGRRDQLRHEAVTLCKDGSVRHIVWLHSRLVRHSADDPAVLSVGLDITEHKRAQGRLAWLADHDPLTDLYNRRRFQEELEQLLNLAIRYQRPGALLYFDLDQFKYINDTSGHQAGDTLLKMVAHMLSGVIRTADVIGRLGGDEFAVILPETTPEGAIEVTKKISACLSRAELTMNSRTHKVSASIGIALFPEHGDNVHELLAAADLAMYQAKEAGRGGWHLFSDEDRSRERMQILVYWKEKIENALLHDRFLLYFQPIMHARDKTIDHYEVLLRMLDEDGAVLEPADFISAAEHSGLIYAIDHLVLRKAIAQAAEIHRRGRRVHFSINLSAHAFNDPELPRVLEHTLAQYGADPESFMFEITETAALEDLLAARKLMETIRALGCSFALDDFGVGFSSFHYIKQLPIDVVKIDGSFIQNLADSPDDQILVKALCDVARGFGKKTTAEFVEDAVTFSLLEKMQVDYVQGYFIGRPAPIIELFSGGFTEA